MKYIEQVFNITNGKVNIIERDFTAEELAEKARQAKMLQKQIIENELSELDIIVPRVVEDIVAQGQFTLHPTKQAIIDRKNELRIQLNSL